ncbi:hypothetical protein VPH35_063283 [Triticum aestivum]
MAQLPGSFPRPEVNDALHLVGQVKESLASDLAVYDEFLDLLGSFYRGEIAADSRAVLARLFAFLDGHPDLAQTLRAFLRRPFQHHADEPVLREEDPPKRPKRERRHPHPVDADCAEAMRFLERVKRADAGLYDRVLALLFHVRAEVKLDANQIYDEARRIFGSAHGDLLRGFMEYLPTGRDFLRRRLPKKEPPEEHRAPAPAPKRKAPAAAIPAYAVGKKKKPRVDERKTTNRRASAAEAWEFETAYTKLVVTLRRTKKALEELKPKPGNKSSEEAEPPEEVKPSLCHRMRPRTFEELYPGRECREVLQEMYGDMLGPMREALEDGVRTELALKTIKRRLKKLEQLAVQMARERRDPARIVLTLDRDGPCESPAGISETKIAGEECAMI